MKEKDKEYILSQIDKINDIGELSDGFHTYDSLYFQRMILFATLVKTYPDISWKSYRHEDEELCFGGGWFIVGIDTPDGTYTYHYENKYWDYFHCVELYKAPHWDGHTDKDVERLLSLVDDTTFDGRRFSDFEISSKFIKAGDIVLEGDGPHFSYRILTSVDGKHWEYFEDGYYHSTSPEYCHWLVKGQKNCSNSELVKIID